MKEKSWDDAQPVPQPSDTGESRINMSNDTTDGVLGHGSFNPLTDIPAGYYWGGSRRGLLPIGVGESSLRSNEGEPPSAPLAARLGKTSISDRKTKIQKFYTDESIEKWVRKGWHSDGQIFYKINEDIEDGFTEINPSEFDRMTDGKLCIPERRGHRRLIRVVIGADVLKTSYSGNYPPREQNKAVRGAIRAFSNKSRNRMLDTLAFISDKRKCFFLTLTYSDNAYTNKPEVFKNHVAIFRKRLFRRFPKSGMLWKLEIKRRKSGLYQGRLAPHYHMLIYGPDCSLPSFQRWCRTVWQEIIGSKGKQAHSIGAKAYFMNDRQKTFAYVAKYAAKADDDGDGVEWGRRWGIAGHIEMTKIEGQISEYEWYTLRRLACQWLEKRSERGKKFARRLRAKRQGFGCTIYGLGDLNDTTYSILEQVFMPGRGRSGSLKLSEERAAAFLGAAAFLDQLFLDLGYTPHDSD
jgi:hypothetical protein